MVRLRPDEEATKATTSWKDPSSFHQYFNSTNCSSLSIEQKLHLAHSVGCSLLYLYSTPWLRENWDSNDVQLPYFGGNSIIQPLIPRKLIHHSSQTYDHDAQLSVNMVGQFGRFLVELWCGATWDQIERVFLAGREGLDANEAVFQKLQEWVQSRAVSIKDKPFHLEGQLFLGAIRSCFFTLGGINLYSASNDLRVQVYRDVLTPLRFALEDFQTRQARKFGWSNVVMEQEGQGTNISGSLQLFDDESIPGDLKERKNAYADEWFDKYAEVLEIASRLSPDRPTKPEERIRVAILDTGVDVTHDDLSRSWNSHQIMYRNFVGPTSEIPRDDHGHGTHVTSIFLKMTENVDIYVCRISADGKKFNSYEVKSAIEWVVEEKEVHFISMSFGFPSIDQSLEPIRQAILKAHASSVLVFAAAGNDKGLNSISFPACLDEVISVGSTDGHGTKSDFLPTLGPGKRLCAIGESIEAAWIHPDKANRKAHGTMVRKAGTSYATPVACGLAAMLMDYIWSERRSGSDNAKPLERYEHQTLRSRRGMLVALSFMMKRDEQASVEGLSPWSLFNENLAASTEGSKSISIIGTIIGRLKYVMINPETGLVS